jgi:hypothetical protein
MQFLCAVLVGLVFKGVLVTVIMLCKINLKKHVFDLNCY